MLGVGCALGLRLVLASIFVEGVIAAEAAAVAEQQTDGGAASKIESAASAATHQLRRDLRMLTQFNRTCGPLNPLIKQAVVKAVSALTMRRASSDRIWPSRFGSYFFA